MTRALMVRVAAMAGVLTCTLAATGTPVQASRRANPECPNKYICLYSGTNYTGEMLRFSVCRFEDIGRRWGNDRVRSIKDYQTPGTRSHFYNWFADPGTWQYVGYTDAPSRYPTVSTEIQISEGLHVC